MSSDWPAAAAACSFAISLGRVRYPSFFIPSAMAPLETTRNDASERAAQVAASRSKMAASPDKALDPIFTTTRRARATEARASLMAGGEQLVKRGVEAVQEPVGYLGGQTNQTVDECSHFFPVVVHRARRVRGRRLD